MSVSYPHIFLEGPQALIVSSALDPAAFLTNLTWRGFWPKLWTPKLTGTDTGGGVEIQHGIDVAKSRGLRVGGWIQCTDDPCADVKSIAYWLPRLDYIEFVCEIEYKNYPHLANALVALTEPIQIPKALVTYGKLDLQIRNEVFAAAGWAVCPEAYDAYTLSQAASFSPLWPGAAVHPLQRKLPPDKFLGNKCGVYRPEGLL